MAPKVIDYSKSVIYKIEHVDNPELLYVGSTTDFIRRKASHKSKCNNSNLNSYNCKLYQIIRDNGNWELFKIMIISEFPCNSKIELIIEEEKYRKELQASLNTLKSHRTIEEKKEQIKLANIKYQENNIDIKEKAKKYRKNNKEKIKQYQENNKDKIKDYKKTYYENKKEIIQEKEKEKMTCNCGSIFNKGDKARHEKTLKHINFINN